MQEPGPRATWAEKDEVTVTGNRAIAPQEQSNDTREEQFIIEVILLNKANEELQKQMQEIKS